MDRYMHITEYIISTFIVGTVAAYSYLAGAFIQAMPTFQASDYLGPVGVTVVLFGAVVGLARVLRYIYTKLQESTDKRLSEKDDLIKQQAQTIKDQTAEISRILQEIYDLKKR